MKISIVSPVYRAEDCLEELVRRLDTVLRGITEDYEIILVDDGSADKSWEVIAQLKLSYKNLIGVKLSRNFGQHYAISAGLDFAKGDWVVVMDCDLQDRPEEINRLYLKAIEGFDLVLGQRELRKDGFFKRFSSYLFYRVFSYLTDTPQDESVANFGIYSKKVIDATKKLKETTRAFPTIVKWVGFKRISVPVFHDERFAGSSSYNWSKLIKLALDIIISYSDKPLRIILNFGFIISISAFLFVIYNVLAHEAGIITISGYTSLIVSVWFLFGLQVIIMGFIGLYLSKVFENVKSRPTYLIDKII